MSTVLTFNFMSIPDFLAGYLYAMTGNNHLAEIETCYQGGDEIYETVELALGELKAGTKDLQYQAYVNFALVAAEVPTALHKCRMIGDDVKALEQWSSQFIHPKELIGHLAKHVAIHRKEIRADLMQTETDWKAHLWFKAGSDVATLLTDALGPVEPYNPFYLQ